MNHSDKLWVLKLLAWLDSRAILVEAWGFGKCHHYTLAYPQADGSLKASLYHSTDVGKMNLLSNGKILANDDVSFMYAWLPVNPERRAKLLLTYDFPFDPNTFDSLSASEFHDLMAEFRAR
jgi:hypothetical protein